MTADAYLALPPDYAASLGGLKWSARGDAIEDADGHTVAVLEEVAQILQGVFAGPAVPPFAFVLNLVRVMKRGEQVAVADGLGRLHRAFGAARGAAGLTRNVGLLIAELCRDVPATAGPPRWAEVKLAIGRVRRLGPPVERPVEPPLARALFEWQIQVALRRWNDEALLRWLKHGDGSAPPADDLAGPVESLPVRIARLLAEARRRPRLVGATVLTPAVDAALTLPPRRRSRAAVPQGGYADVTTRGDPDRLLPSQFALDPDEFVRRFADRELLYYLREEPHATEKPDRVIVLDQGVRTWGGVRLALAAAALVLLGKDPRRVGPGRLVFSASEDAVGANDFDPDDVADRLEASDLSPHPAGGLRRALAADGDGPRDVILLTHPRSAREPAVAAAAKGRRPTDRLFALSVDDRGRAELAEWAEDGPVPVRTFRVDLTAAEAARPGGAAPPPARPASAAPPPWTGDVEPVGFPFCPGIVAEPTLLGFSADGDWLVTAGRYGSLHGLTFDGSPPEVLPRAYRNGTVLARVDAVLGVAGGVVVCGRMTPAAGRRRPGPVTVTIASTGNAPQPFEAPVSDEVYVVAHYDRAARRVRLHEIGPATGEPRWAVFPDMNCVAVRPAKDSPWFPGDALDLNTLGRRYGPSESTGGRAHAAYAAMMTGGSSPPYTLPVLSRLGSEPAGRDPFAVLVGNAVHVRKADPGWEPFTPLRDGKPMLAGVTFDRAELAGNVLAAVVGRTGERTLVLFRGPDGATIAELPHTYRGAPFKLSADGSLIARRRGQQEVEVARTADPGRAIATAPAARLHSNLDVRLAANPFRLTLRIGGFEHAFRESGGRLVHTLDHSIQPTKRGAPIGSATLPTAYDPDRFPRNVAWELRWRAVFDRFGQVLLYTETGRLVAAFLVRRDRAAAWAPGGAFWGDPALIGGPPTPDADRVIGEAIRDAGGDS